MQERGALQADLDEGRLHAGQHARHLAHVDIAHQAAAAARSMCSSCDDAAAHHGDARLLRRDVDEDVFAHAGGSLAKRLEQLGGLVQRQAHDAGIAAAELGDERRGAALDGVGAGLVHRLAGVDVSGDLRAAELAKTHRGSR